LIPKKFLLVSQVFYPDQVSTANLFTGLCGVLAEDDIAVEVWTAHPSYTEQKRQPSKVRYRNIDIRILSSTNFQKDNLFGRTLNALTFTFSAVLKLLFSRENTPVWSHTTPPFLGYFISGACKIKKRKFIYILLDILPEGLIRLGKVSRKNIFIRFWKRSFIKTLERSDKIIAIGRDIKEFVACYGEEYDKKTEYIPHWQDANLIFPIEFRINNYIIDNGLQDKFVVQYSGNMGLWNEMKTIGKAVSRNIGDVIFIFVGGGIRKEELLNEFSSKDQHNFLLIPFQSNDSFNNTINASHVHLITLKEGLEGMAVPSKIYGIMAAGRPFIAMVPEKSEIAFVVREENCGFVIKPTDIDGLINAISLLKSDEGLRRQLGNNSRSAFEKKYTVRLIAERYKTVLNELLKD
jgi:colanic acid biosynthesis glycosyl transferase WcaI